MPNSIGAGPYDNRIQPENYDFAVNRKIKKEEKKKKLATGGIVALTTVVQIPGYTYRLSPTP
jgi:hypothetical protein